MELPKHPAPDRVRERARAAFVAEFEKPPGFLDRLRAAIIPVVVTSAVGGYLTWAFSAAMMLNR